MKPKKSIFRKIVGVVGYTLIAIIFALLIFVFISNVRGNVTFIGDYTVIWVKTGSMKDTIPERSYILVEKVGAKEVSVGDVIMFYSDDPQLSGALNTHRVTEVIGDHEEFVTKGDNNPTADDYTAKADKIVARYKRTLPFLSRIGRFLSTGFGYVVTMTLVFALFMAIYVPDIIKASRKIDEDIKAARAEKIDKLVKEEVERLKREGANRERAENQTGATQKTADEENTQD